MSDDEIVYDDEVNHIDWLKVTELASYMVVLDPTLEEINQEQESWDNAVAKYSKDESFVPTENAYYSVDISYNPEYVSGHDWVGSVTIGTRGTNARECAFVCRDKNTGSLVHNCAGKIPPRFGEFPSKNAYREHCKENHEGAYVVVNYADDERHEFKPDWNSISDRPTELDNIGLPGLREANANDKWLWFSTNHVCSECHIMTPKQYDVCQNCDSILV